MTLSAVSITPGRAAFEQRWAEDGPVMLHASLVTDGDTPLSMYARLKPAFEGQSFLLESVLGGEQRGRYSILGFSPDLIWRCRDGQAHIERCADGAIAPLSEPPLQSLRAWLDRHRLPATEGLPSMLSGVIGHLGYEMVGEMEDLPTPRPDVLGIPDAALMRPRLVVVHDSAMGRTHLASTLWENGGRSGEEAYDEASAILQAALAALSAPAVLHPADPVPGAELDFASSVTREEYHAMVEAAKAYIRAGDIFQVVPSQRFSAPFALPPLALYRALRYLNPSPFLFCLDMVDYALVGSSPEILVRLREGEVTIRPIAGTRPRGTTPEEDRALAESLLADPKEVSEHLMLLDLGRNDVGRACIPGTVEVTERMIIERYSHVMHIVSNVRGRIRDGYGAVDALAAGFPAGTVSGAPKIRAMEIIHELEGQPRKFYAGCVGYFDGSGNMDTCIALRTALIKDGMLHVQAGGGVVADSDPEAEYQESCNKARAVMRAAQLAGSFA